MQLYNFLTDDNLNNLRKSMNAPLIDSSELLYKGAITYADIFDVFSGKEIQFTEIDIKDDGLLYHKGVLISLNIKDFNQGSSGNGLPKLHISFCKTLQNMTDAGRFKRYVTSCRTDSLRKIRLTSQFSNQIQENEYFLEVCKLCLEKLRWQGFSTRDSSDRKQRLVQSFNLSEFYKTYAPQFYNDFSNVLYSELKESPINNYSATWTAISYKYRESKNWACEICHINCLTNKANLHTHHKNGLKYDNDISNLQALCQKCHAQQPYHGHMLRKTTIKATQ